RLRGEPTCRAPGWLTAPGKGRVGGNRSGKPLGETVGETWTAAREDTAFGTGQDRGARGTAAQPEKHRRGNPPQPPRRVYGVERLRQVVPRVRYHLCRGAAALRGKPVRVRPPVPGTDG